MILALFSDTLAHESVWSLSLLSYHVQSWVEACELCQEVGYRSHSNSALLNGETRHTQNYK